MGPKWPNSTSRTTPGCAVSQSSATSKEVARHNLSHVSVSGQGTRRSTSPVTDTQAPAPSPSGVTTLHHSVGGWVGSILHTTSHSCILYAPDCAPSSATTLIPSQHKREMRHRDLQAGGACSATTVSHRATHMRPYKVIERPQHGSRGPLAKYAVLHRAPGPSDCIRVLNGARHIAAAATPRARGTLISSHCSHRSHLSPLRVVHV